MRSMPQPVVVGFAGEAEAGQRRTDDMERIGSVAAMGNGIDQRLDHLVELDHRAWPAVGDDQRHRLRVRRADMQVVDGKPIDLGGELTEPIERRLTLAPVVALAPVGADVLDPCERRALAPVVDQLCLRPARVAQTYLEVIEQSIRNLDAIGRDGGGHDLNSLTRRACDWRGCDPPRSANPHCGQILWFPLDRTAHHRQGRRPTPAGPPCPSQTTA